LTVPLGYGVLNLGYAVATGQFAGVATTAMFALITALVVGSKSAFIQVRNEAS
jgi:hypothetical protein